MMGIHADLVLRNVDALTEEERDWVYFLETSAASVFFDWDIAMDTFDQL